ncbi:MAG: hypothetical protein ACREJM_01795, partial [Candidatus Saccharimonadales bacterium]
AAAGAELARVAVLVEEYQRPHHHDGDGANAPRPMVDRRALEAALVARPDCRLVMIDSARVSFRGATPVLSYGEPQALAELAARHGATIVVTPRLQGRPAGAALRRSLAALAQLAEAAVVLSLVRDRGRPERRMLVPAKNQYADDCRARALRIGGDGRVSWEDEPLIMTEALWGAAPMERADAARWLSAALADGARPSTELFDEAAEHGFSRDQLKRAKRLIAAEAAHVGYGTGSQWLWRLAGSGFSAPVEGSGVGRRDLASGQETEAGRCSLDAPAPPTRVDGRREIRGRAARVAKTSAPDQREQREPRLMSALAAPACAAPVEEGHEPFDLSPVATIRNSPLLSKTDQRATVPLRTA